MFIIQLIISVFLAALIFISHILLIIKLQYILNVCCAVKKKIHEKDVKPAQEVTSDWLNDTIQEELCSVIEQEGVSLAKGENDLLKKSVKKAFDDDTINRHSVGYTVPDKILKNSKSKFNVKKKINGNTKRVNARRKALLNYLRTHPTKKPKSVKSLAKKFNVNVCTMRSDLKALKL